MRQEDTTSITARCFHGEPASCSHPCPFFFDVRTFLLRVKDSKWGLAYKLYRNATVFPAIVSELCGAPCRAECQRGTEPSPPPVITNGTHIPSVIAIQRYRSVAPLAEVQERQLRRTSHSEECSASARGTLPRTSNSEECSTLVRGTLPRTSNIYGRSALASGDLPWLGRQDLNLRMTESESVALPLGDAPVCGVDSGIRTHAYRSHNPVS